MKNIAQYGVDIKLALKGGKDLENAMKKAFQLVPDFQERLHNMGITKLDGQLEQLATSSIKHYKQMRNAMENYNDAVRANTGDNQSLNTMIAEEQAGKQLVKTYETILTTLPNITQQQETLERVVKRSYAYQLEAAQKNIKLLKEEGVEYRELNTLLNKTEQETKSANSTAPLQKLNKELETRYKKLEKVKSMLEVVNRVGFKTDTADKFKGELYNIKAYLQDMAIPLNEIDQEFDKLNVNPKLLKDIGRAEEKFKKTQATLKKMGANSTDLAKLENEFTTLINQSVKLNDTADVKAFNTELNKRKKILQDLAPMYKQMRKSDLLPNAKSANVQGKAQQVQAVALDFNVDSDAITKTLQEAKAEMRELTGEEKKYKKEVTDAAKAIDKQKNKLIEERNVLTDMLSKNKSLISKEAAQETLTAINRINLEVKQLETTTDSLRSKRLFSNDDLLKSTQLVERAKADVTELKTLAGNVKVHIQLSGGMGEAKNYANSLATDMVKVMNVTDKTSNQYKEMSHFVQLVQQEQKRLTDGGKENYTLAKKNLTLLSSRYNEYVRLNAKADKFAQYIKENNEDLGVQAVRADEYVQKIREAATAQLDLSKSTRSQLSTLEEVDTFQNKINKAAREKTTIDKQLYTLQKKLTNELANIERLQNSKKPYATTKALEEATAQADELRGELKKVEQVMSALKSERVGDLVDTDKLKKAKTTTEELNRAFDKTSAKVKEVKSNLAELSSVKWGGNILKRAVAYASMYAGIYELIGGLRRGGEAVVQFDTQMRTISAVFDVTQQRAKGLTKELMGLSLAYGGAVSDINEAALSLGRAGIATEKVTEATEVVIKMAKLTGDTIATSANAVITYQQVFGATHPVLKEVGDQLAYVANQSRMSTQDIGTFSNYALAAASAAGISMEAINALATSFSNAGVNASTIGTQIRRFSSLMKDNSTAAQDFFLKLGTTQTLFAQQMQEGKQSADSAMTWISERLRSMSKQEFAGVIQGMDILASNSITLLRNNADEFLRHFKNLNAGVAGEIDKADLIADGYQASFEKMKTAISQAFISITENGAPAIQEMMDKITTAFEWIAEHPTQILESISAAFKTLAIIGTGAVAIRLTSAFRTLGKAVIASGESVKLVQTLFNTSFKDMKAAVLLPVTAVKSLTASLVALKTRFMAVRAAGGVATFTTLKLAIQGTVTVMWRLVTASLAFIATPLGATLAVLGAAIGAYYYFTEDAADSTDKLNKNQADLLNTTQDLTTAKRQLAEVMDRLNKGTSQSVQADIEKAASLSLVIDKATLAKTKLGEMVHQTELLNQQKIKAQKIVILQKKVETLELKNDPGNGALIAQYEGQIKRLKEESENITVKVKESVASKKAFSDLFTKIDTLRYAEHQAVILGKDTKEGAAWGATIKRMKDELASLGVKVELFKGNNIRAQLETYLTTAEGIIASKRLILKTDATLDPEAKAKLESEIKSLEAQMEKAGNFKAKIVNAEAIKSFTDYGKGVLEQFKAGFDISPQLLHFQTMFDSTFANILATSARVSGEMQKSFDDAMPKKADQGLKDMVKKLKGLENQFAEVKNAKEAQRIYTEIRNTVAEMADEYGMAAPELVSHTQAMADKTGELNAQIQELTGHNIKVFDVLTGGDGMTEKTAKLGQAIDMALAAEDRLKLKKDEIITRIGKSIDLTYGLRNAQLSISDAVEIEVKIQNVLARQKVQLMTLDKARLDILQNVITFENKATRAAALEGLAKRYGEVSEETKKSLANLKATKAAIKKATAAADKLAKSSKSSAKSATSHADELERANTALKKLHASYLKMAGDSNLSVGLAMEADLEKIDQMGKKAQATAGYIKQVKQAYIAAQTTKLNDQENAANASMTDVGLAKEYLAQELRLRQQEEFYNKRNALIEAEYMVGVAKIEEQGMSELEKEKAINELKLATHKEYLEAKQTYDQQYYTSLALTVGAGLGDVLGIMKNLQSAGLIQSKGWVKAMQGIQVAQAIMTTYSSAVTAYDLGLKAGGPWGGPTLGMVYSAIAIAKGMSQVAMIKAQKFHTGGYVDKPLKSGMGGMQDDEVNAVLQKGEYVLSRSMIQDIKNGSRNKIKPSEDVNNSDSQSLQTRELAAFADSMKPEVVIVNSMDPAVVEDWATSRRGREVIQNVVNA